MKEKSKRKICFLSYRKDPCTVVENFSRTVSDHGYDVSVITIRKSGEPEFEIANGRKFYRISLLENYPLQGRINRLVFVLKTITILNRNRFHIIQITTTCPYFILLRLFTFTYSKAIFQILTYPIATSYIRSLKRMIFTSLQCYFMDSIVIQSEELKKNWIGLRKLRKAIVIPVGFNKNDFYPINDKIKLKKRSDLGLNEHQSVLIYCGAISHHRKIDLLIKAFKKVATNNKDVKLLMVGAGVSLLDIQILSKQLNIEDRIIFTGNVPYAEVRNYIGMADIGLSYIPINNNYNYNPPLKTFEYLACGLPTVATKTESNCKIIRDGLSGILVNDAPNDVADAISKLLADKSMQNILSRNSRKSILKFDYNQITHNSFLPLYKLLLAHN
jgi:glycosyltransferase involved in cell wall biosynthesis